MLILTKQINITQPATTNEEVVEATTSAFHSLCSLTLPIKGTKIFSQELWEKDRSRKSHKSRHKLSIHKYKA